MTEILAKLGLAQLLGGAAGLVGQQGLTDKPFAQARLFQQPQLPVCHRGHSCPHCMTEDEQRKKERKCLEEKAKKYQEEYKHRCDDYIVWFRKGYKRSE